MKKTLILTMDFGKLPEWAIKGKSRQISEWIEANKQNLPFDDLILMPNAGETKIYWLEGKIDDLEDLKTIEQIKDKITPVLGMALGIKMPHDDSVIDPFTKAVAQLRAHREKSELQAHKRDKQ